MLDKNTNRPTTSYESLYDLNLISLWWQSGSNWSLTIREAIQADIEQSIVREASKTTSRLVLFGVVAALAILVTTAFSQAPKIYQSVQEVGINSFK